MQSLAVIETTTSLDELKRILLEEHQFAPAFTLERCNEFAPGYPRFKVCVEDSNAIQAYRAARCILLAFLDAADRGMVSHFRIVLGADLLRRPLTSENPDEEPGGGGCLA